MFFFMDEERWNQPRTNEQRVQLHFWVIYFWDYKLQFQTPQSYLLKRNKTVKNNPWKLTFWDIPPTKQEQNVTCSRPKGSLLGGINKFKITQATQIFWRDILLSTKTDKIKQDSKMFHKNCQKIEQTQNLKHQLLWRYLLIK